MVNILFIVQELQIKNMYVCQPGFHVMFSAFTALTYIAKGIKLMLTKKPTIGRVLRQVNWEQNGQRKQRVKSNTGSGWHLKLLTGTQAFCLLKYSTAILMCEWLVEKDELIYRKLQLPQESVSVCFSKSQLKEKRCHDVSPLHKSHVPKMLHEGFRVVAFTNGLYRMWLFYDWWLLFSCYDQLYS